MKMQRCDRWLRRGSFTHYKWNTEPTGVNASIGQWSYHGSNPPPARMDIFHVSPAYSWYWCGDFPDNGGGGWGWTTLCCSHQLWILCGAGAEWKSFLLLWCDGHNKRNCPSSPKQGLWLYRQKRLPGGTLWFNKSTGRILYFISIKQGFESSASPPW